MTVAWEAFTSVSPSTTGDDPDVRELHGESYHWPDGEVHNGIAGYQITCHGDDPAGAFVRCWGRSREAVEQCLANLVALVRSGVLRGLYP